MESEHGHFGLLGNVSIHRPPAVQLESRGNQTRRASSSQARLECAKFGQSAIGGDDRLGVLSGGFQHACARGKLALADRGPYQEEGENTQNGRSTTLHLQVGRPR